MANFYASYPVLGSGGGSGVSSLNGLTGALTLAAGTNITIVPTGNTLTINSTSGGGTVTSVGLSLPAEFSVTGSPVTTSGTLSATWASEAQHSVFAGPSGSAGTPTFRALVASDIPALPYSSNVLTNAHIFVGNGSNVATDVAVSGDLTLANTGAFTIANLAVTNAKIANATIDLTTKVTGVLPVANGGTNSSSYTAGSVIFAGAGGTSLTENNAQFFWDNATARLFMGANTSIGGSNAGVQYSDATTANRGQFKAHSYFNGTSVAGISTLTSRSGTVGVNNAVVAGQDYSKWTAQAGATTVGSAPISGTFAFKANTVNSLTVTSDYHIQLTNLAGTLGDRLYLGSEGALQLPFYTTGVAQFDASGNITSAPLSPSSLTLTNNHIFVGNGSNVATDVAMSGDATIVASGALTLATVNGNVGSFGTASSVSSFTVNAKGLITAASNTSIQIAESQVTNLVSDLAAKQSTTLTNAHILVGNGSNVATDVAVSGDLTLANTGAFTIANLAVTNAKIANATIDLTTKVTGLLPIANGGTGQSTASAAFGALSPLTTKGDLLSFSTLNIRVPVGADSLVLTADSTQPSGIAWSSSGGGTLPTINQYFYVTKGGSDSTGTGTYNNPYLTIEAAIAAITDATTTKRYQIIVGPGNYTPATMVLKPYVYVKGQNVNTTKVTVTSNFVTLDPAFASGAQRTGIRDMYLTGTTGINADLAGIGGAGGIVLDISNVSMNGGLSFLGRSGGIDQVNIDNLKLLSTGSVLIDNDSAGIVNGLYIGSAPGNFSVTSSAAPSVGDFWNVKIAGNMVTSATIGTNTINMRGVQLAGTLSVGANVTINADSASFTKLKANTTGAGTINSDSNAQFMKYEPATAGNWVTPPTLVGPALDTLAASGIVKTQTANTIFAGPSSGGAAAPTFRALVTADIPVGIAYLVNKFTLTPTDITNQFVTLTSTPTSLTKTILDVIGGIEQDYGVDFSVSGTTLSFLGDLATGGGAALVSGDKLVVQFN